MTPVCESSAAPGRFSTRKQIFALGGVCAASSLLVFSLDPTRHAVYPSCIFHQTTGLYCAGCGATRALYALLHGRVLDAVHDNVLFVLALPILMVIGGSFIQRAWRKNAWPSVKMEPGTAFRNGLGVFAVMAVFMILRNLPGMPFDLLKPLGG